MAVEGLGHQLGEVALAGDISIDIDVLLGQSTFGNKLISEWKQNQLILFIQVHYSTTRAEALIAFEPVQIADAKRLSLESCHPAPLPSLSYTQCDM